MKKPFCLIEKYLTVEHRDGSFIIEFDNKEYMRFQGTGPTPSTAMAEFMRSLALLGAESLWWNRLAHVVLLSFHKYDFESLKGVKS